MRVLTVRNVHSGFPRALEFMRDVGERRGSRNGDVFVAPWPVTTVYEKPCERVMFWPQRDANPFFHFYEALWMLAGRNDVAPLERYVKNSINYSDDGTTLHGAYGYRWRQHFRRDQLAPIAEELKRDPTSRRCILQMWDCTEDLARNGKDLPCNTVASFQRGTDGALNLVVFCRSNDIIWGCYGANAVQFSMLLEYMATWIGCPVGTYTQVSVNWHAYDSAPWHNVSEIRPDRANYTPDPYADRHVYSTPMCGPIVELDKEIEQLLKFADDDSEKDINHVKAMVGGSQWAYQGFVLLAAHKIFKKEEAPRKYQDAMKLLGEADSRMDWIVAARDWIQRRYETYLAKQLLNGGNLTHP